MNQAAQFVEQRSQQQISATRNDSPLSAMKYCAKWIEQNRAANEMEKTDSEEADYAIAALTGLKQMDETERDRFNRELIDLVQEQPHLWNFRLKDHRDQEKCQQSWHQIAVLLRREDVDWCTCHDAFKLLRDAFRRNLNKISSDISYEEARQQIKWKYFIPLEFLKDTLAKRRPAANRRQQIAPNAGTETDNISSDFSSPSADTLSNGNRKRDASQMDFLPKHLIDSFTQACHSVVELVDREMKERKYEDPASDANVVLGKLIATEVATFPPAKQPRLRVAIRSAVYNILEKEENNKEAPSR